MKALVWFLLALVALAGCWPTASADDARRFFRTARVCPESRIVARERTDLRLGQFGCMLQAWRRATAPEGKEVERGHDSGIGVGDVMDLMCGMPPPEIKNDPERLEIWLTVRERGFRYFEAQSGAIYEVEGCGYHRFLSCSDFQLGCKDLGSVDPRRP